MQEKQLKRRKQKFGRQGEVKRIQISSSVSNFRDKLLKRTNLQEYSFINDTLKKTLFVGLYHVFDYIRFIMHRGERVCFFCGSDILYLQENSLVRGNRFWRRVLRKVKARYICENKVEQETLRRLGIEAEVHPMIFDNPNDFEVSYKHSNKPHVWMCAQPERKQEYGVDKVEKIAHQMPDITFHIYGVREGFHTMWWDNGILMNRNYVNQPNIVYHGKVSNEQFNEEIKNYQGCIRFNKFDGFAESLAKSALLGQYQWSFISYPMMENYKIEAWLWALRNTKKPNYKGEKYWREKLENSLKEVLK